MRDLIEPYVQRRILLGKELVTLFEAVQEFVVAELDGRVVGCVALRPAADGVYELSKMAVDPALRGRGVGRRVITAAVERARSLGATSLFLGSSTRLAPAVHLYESVGFTHVPREEIDMPYERANVFMVLRLDRAA